jgi:hypothetical protein
LICRGKNWPVKTWLPPRQIIYKRHQISISTMNILNMSFDTRLPWGIHSTASTGPIRLSQLISHHSFVCIQKSRSATPWSIIRYCIPSLQKNKL